MASILVVEDEVEVAELVRDALVDVGFKVKVALGDKAAYRLLQREARSFSALIADINLGEGVTGFDVAREARKLNQDIRVIYITGHAAHLLSRGVDGAVMFPKPFDPVELARHTRALLSRDAEPMA
jgi:DNA-binding response OmpR family regulator